MLNEFRRIDITWDKASRKIYDLLRTSSSDENGRKLVVQVLNNGSTVNLEGTELRLYWETKDKHYIGFDRFELIEADKGIFELAFSTGMLSNVGKLKANLHLMNPADETIIVTSEPFNIEVFEGIDNESIEASNSFTALTNALVRLTRIEEQEEERKSNEVARNQAESSRNQAERTRKNAEDDRITNEEERKSNEVAREDAENKREENESTRQQNESSREDAEQSRVNTFETNEADRQSTFEDNEDDRQSTFTSNENNRQSDFEDNEDARQQNEQTRQDQESTRQSNESTRQSNEQSRQATFEDLQQAMEAVEQDYANRAEDLELTYSPRLLNLENEIEDNILPSLAELEAGEFSSRVTVRADSMAEDSILFRMMRADDTLLAWVSTGPGGTGLKIHMADQTGTWSGYISIDEDGTIKQNGVPVATK